MYKFAKFPTSWSHRVDKSKSGGQGKSTAGGVGVGVGVGGRGSGKRRKLHEDTEDHDATEVLS